MPSERWTGNSSASTRESLNASFVLNRVRIKYCILSNLDIELTLCLCFQDTAAPRVAGGRGARRLGLRPAVGPAGLPGLRRSGGAALGASLLRQGRRHVVAGRAAVHDARRPLPVQRRRARQPLRQDLARQLLRARGAEPARALPGARPPAPRARRAPRGRGRAAPSVAQWPEPRLAPRRDGPAVPSTRRRRQGSAGARRQRQPRLRDAASSGPEPRRAPIAGAPAALEDRSLR